VIHREAVRWTVWLAHLCAVAACSSDGAARGGPMTPLAPVTGSVLAAGGDTPASFSADLSIEMQTNDADQRLHPDLSHQGVGLAHVEYEDHGDSVRVRLTAPQKQRTLPLKAQLGMFNWERIKSVQMTSGKSYPLVELSSGDVITNAPHAFARTLGLADRDRRAGQSTDGLSPKAMRSFARALFRQTVEKELGSQRTEASSDGIRTTWETIVGGYEVAAVRVIPRTSNAKAPARLIVIRISNAVARPQEAKQ
jgi:hypothetical protein